MTSTDDENSEDNYDDISDDNTGEGQFGDDE